MSDPKPLSPRQKQVYGLKMTGMRTVDIAEQLDLHEHTVDTYIRIAVWKGWPRPPKAKPRVEGHVPILRKCFDEGVVAKIAAQRAGCALSTAQVYYTKFKREAGQKILEPWPLETIEYWSNLHTNGQSFTQIAKIFGLTKGQVAGAIHRYKKAQNATSETHHRRSRSSR